MKERGIKQKRKIKLYNLSLKQRAKRHIYSFRKYCYIMGIGAAILFSLLFVFTSLFKVHYLLSLFFAYIVSISLNFFLSKKVIFNNFSPKRAHKQYYEFFIVSMGGFFGNLIFLFILVDLVGLWYLLAELIIGFFGLPLMFLTHKKIVFSHK